MIYLAPLQGYTEVGFRRAWSNLFTGIDMAVSPFIPLAEGMRFRNSHLRDVIPHENIRIPVIPQILGNDPVKFIRLSERLADLGYKTVNWNMGCPKKSVARKKRGSGILPFPEEIRKILDTVIPGMPLRLSIKTRMGYQHPDEFFRLIEVFNDYPLESLMIHPRIGVQLYEGELYLNILDQVIDEIRHPIVFSGDISDKNIFLKTKNRYPQISDWMLGRGVLVNPFLPEMIGNNPFDREEQTIRKRQRVFHEELYCEMRDKLRRERSMLNKMKDYWSYFARWFEGENEIFRQLAHQQTLASFMVRTAKILDEQPLAGFYGRSNQQVSL